MNDLQKHWPDVALRLRQSSRCCVLSDFDGTLVPLRERPDLVELPVAQRELLARMARTDRIVLGIVSGRALSDLVARVGIPAIWYVGNHGFEILDPMGEESHFFTPEDVRYLDVVRDELVAETAQVPGVLIEHKGPIVAVHYRQVEPTRTPEVESAFIRILERHHSRVMFFHGMMVLEARLRGGSNKGSAVRHIRRALPPGTLTLYFGDDLTDHDAFRELSENGLTVSVGREASPLAHFSLPDPEAVVEVLEWIHGTLRGI